MLRKIFLKAILILSVLAANAQTELTLPYLESVYQASYINPAARPDNKVSIGLPGLSSVYAGATNTGFTFLQSVKRRNDSLIFSPGQAIGKMKNKNFLYSSTSIDLFHLRVKVRNSFFSFHAIEHASFRFAYPKDFFKLGWEGNAPSIGQKLDLTGLGLDINHYREYALGWSNYNEKKGLSYGGRVKLLQGLANVNFKNKDLTLTTGNDFYNLNATANGQLNTSLPYVFNNDSTSTWNVNGDTTTDASKAIPNYFSNFRNKGFGIDLGAEYEFGEKWLFTASLTNIGFITWNTNATNYAIKGETSFQGFDPVKELYKDSSNLKEYADSIKNRFNYTKSYNSYTTWLAPRLFLAAKYKILPKTQAGLSVLFEKQQRIRTGVSLGLNQQVGRWFEVAATYSTQFRSWNNFGVAVMLKPGPFQIYAATDHLFRITTYEDKSSGSSISAPASAKLLNFRFGINLVFGKIKTADRQPLPGE